MVEQVDKETYEKVQKKLEELKSRRSKLSRAIGEAREHGDLSENSAYHEAKNEQGLNEMRIREFEAKLAEMVIVEKKDLPKRDRVTFGATVKILAMDTKREDEYTIVSETEADIFERKISTDSPIGAAIFNRKQGEVVEVEVPRGLISLKILEIR